MYNNNNNNNNLTRIALKPTDFTHTGYNNPVDNCYTVLFIIIFSLPCYTCGAPGQKLPVYKKLLVNIMLYYYQILDLLYHCYFLSISTDYVSF